MSYRRPALLTLVVTEEGAVEVEPGERFGPEHVELLTSSHRAVQSVVKEYPDFLTFGMN